MLPVQLKLMKRHVGQQDGRRSRRSGAISFDDFVLRDASSIHHLYVVEGESPPKEEANYDFQMIKWV